MQVAYGVVMRGHDHELNDMERGGMDIGVGHLGGDNLAYGSGGLWQGGFQHNDDTLPMT